MICTNLRNLQRTGESASDWGYTTDVDCTTTTGILWFKKTHTTTRKIAHRYGSLGWFFMDDGTFTPDVQIERLVRPVMFERGWR
jgi:hypothetical protein